MADDRLAEEIYWVEPKRRGILPLDQFHVSDSLAKVIKSGRFETRMDTAFAEVVSLCAEAVDDRESTWINVQIEEAVNRLHQLGHAHSVECWRDEKLVGGLYGIRLAGAFFGESMFSRESNASKVALAALIDWMRAEKMNLLDCQFLTPHLSSLGAVEISRSHYLALLNKAFE